MSLFSGFVTARRRWAAWRAEPIGTALAATFSRLPSVFHEAVEQHKEPAPGVGSWGLDWVEKFREASIAPFVVVGDDDSRLLVEPSIAIHSLEHRKVFAGELLMRHETRLTPGDRVAAFGIVDEVASIGHDGCRGSTKAMPRMSGPTRRADRQGPRGRGGEGARVPTPLHREPLSSAC